MENQTKTKLTLNPEEEKQSNILLEGAPVRQTVQPIVQTQTEYNAGSIDESMLSNDEKEMVAQFANEIDISNAKQVIQYGSSAQKSISDFSVNILGKVKMFQCLMRWWLVSREYLRTGSIPKLNRWLME